MTGIVTKGEANLTMTNHSDLINKLEDDLRLITTSPVGSIARHLQDDKMKVQQLRRGRLKVHVHILFLKAFFPSSSPISS